MRTKTRPSTWSVATGYLLVFQVAGLIGASVQRVGFGPLLELLAACIAFDGLWILARFLFLSRSGASSR